MGSRLMHTTAPSVVRGVEAGLTKLFAALCACAGQNLALFARWFVEPGACPMTSEICRADSDCGGDQTEAYHEQCIFDEPPISMATPPSVG